MASPAARLEHGQARAAAAAHPAGVAFLATEMIGVVIFGAHKLAGRFFGCGLGVPPGTVAGPLDERYLPGLVLSHEGHVTRSRSPDLWVMSGTPAAAAAALLTQRSLDRRWPGQLWLLSLTFDCL